MSDDTRPPTPRELCEDDIKRPRGFLTEVDRSFLHGFKDYEYAQQSSNRRKEIRERTKNGVDDLRYLSLLDADQREDIFDELDEDDSVSLRAAVSALIQTIYIWSDSDIEWLEETVAQAVHSAELELKPDDVTYHGGNKAAPLVDVDIDVTRGYSVDEIEDRFRSGEAHTLTPTEVGVLVREGRVDGEDLRELDTTHQEGEEPADPVKRLPDVDEPDE